MKAIKGIFLPCWVVLLWIFGNLSVPAWAEDALPKDSLYKLKSQWKDQNGQTIELKSLSGTSVYITMGYTGCAHACPLIIAKVREIEKELKNKKIESYKIVFVSFDTVKDKPESLKKYMAKKELDEKKWTMLSSTNDGDVRELANVLNINYKDLGDGDFVHSNVITLLNVNGVILADIQNLNSDIDPLIKNIEVVNGK